MAATYGFNLLYLILGIGTPFSNMPIILPGKSDDIYDYSLWQYDAL